jgi:hypothetical protein
VSLALTVQRMVNSTSLVFGRHHDGYLLPLSITINNSETSFIAALTVLNTADMFLMFAVASGQILCASKDAHTMLEVHARMYCSRCRCSVLTLLTPLCVLLSLGSCPAKSCHRARS